MFYILSDIGERRRIQIRRVSANSALPSQGHQSTSIAKGQRKNTPPCHLIYNKKKRLLCRLLASQEHHFRPETNLIFVPTDQVTFYIRLFGYNQRRGDSSSSWIAFIRQTRTGRPHYWRRRPLLLVASCFVDLRVLPRVGWMTLSTLCCVAVRQRRLGRPHRLILLGALRVKIF